MSADVHVRGEAVEQSLEAAFELAGQGGFCHGGPGGSAAWALAAAIALS